jgi:hypothetical protein
MNTYDVYGFLTDDLETVRASVESALGVVFAAHESSYRGGDYYRFGEVGNEELILQYNLSTVDGEWAEEGFREFPTLLYVDNTSRAEEIEKFLTAKNMGASLLRRQTT